MKNLVAFLITVSAVSCGTAIGARNLETAKTCVEFKGAMRDEVIKRCRFFKKALATGTCDARSTQSGDVTVVCMSDSDIVHKLSRHKKHNNKKHTKASKKSHAKKHVKKARK
jgi:hypothetical protein